MKFFTVSLFVLLSSAILGGSFATPAHTHLGGLVGDVVGTVGNVLHGAGSAVGHLVGGVVGTVADVTDEVLEKLSYILPKLTDDVLNAVNKVLETTGKGLCFVVHDVVDGTVSLVSEALGCSMTITINEDTREISIDDHIIGHICDNGSIVDHQNNLVGMCDREHGVLVFVGGAVDEVLHAVGCVGEILSNLLHSLDVTLGGIIDKVREDLVNLSDDLRQALADLPSATADILNKLIEDLHKTGEAVVCTAEKVLGKIFSFRDVSGKIVFSVNAETFEVTCAGHTIGHMNEDGSIVDSDGNVIGCLIEGLLIVVGPIVETLHGLLHDVAHAAQNGLGGLLDVLG